MTNEEKAREIANRQRVCYDAEQDERGIWHPTITSNHECEQSALEMAEWKDEQAKESFKKFYDKGLELGKSIAKQQFKEYLEKKIDSICEFGCKTESQELSKTCADQMVVIAEIINELFGE